MNKYAHKLKLTNTKFVNPTGLTNVENYSTARDLAVLTSVCLKDHVMRLIFKRKVHKCEVKNEKLGYNRYINCYLEKSFGRIQISSSTNTKNVLE